MSTFIHHHYHLWAALCLAVALLYTLCLGPIYLDRSIPSRRKTYYAVMASLAWATFWYFQFAAAPAPVSYLVLQLVRPR
jgi:hypothetical protein